MFKRLILDDSAAWFTVVAFVTAASIYLTIAWRALRMKCPQIEHFEHLPFATPTPACVALRVSAGTGLPPAARHSRFSRSGLPGSAVS